MASKKTTLESLAKLIYKNSASADKKFAALAEDIADIKSTMVTKDDLAEAVEKLDDRLIAVESKIAGIHNRIDDAKHSNAVTLRPASALSFRTSRHPQSACSVGPISISGITTYVKGRRMNPVRTYF
jgi:hypothetical protein